LKSSFSLPLQGEAGPAQIPSGLCGVNSRGLDAGGIFTPHFERSEIVAGPPAEPREFRSDIFKQTPIDSYIKLKASGGQAKPVMRVRFLPRIGSRSSGRLVRGLLPLPAK